MKTILNLKILLLFIICFYTVTSKGQQNFKFKSNAFSVNNINFYKILIDNTIRSKCKTNFSDLRIFDSLGNETAYFIYEPNSISFNEQFFNLPFTEVNSVSNKFSEIIVENKSSDTLNYLLVDVLNTSNSKLYSLSGSNDNKRWIGISDFQFMRDIVSTEKLSVLKEISFPSVNYKYICLRFNDSISSAIKVNKVGIVKNKIIYPSFTNVKNKLSTNTLNTTKKVTSLILTFPVKSDVDYLNFNIPTLDFYQREISIYTSVLTRYHKKTIYKKELIAKTSLSSNYKNIIAIYRTKLDTLFIEIENNDNPPLIIKEITSSQKDVWAICKLTVLNTYNLYFGNDSLGLPDYDLIYFKNKINKNLDEIKIKSIIELSKAPTITISEGKWYKSKLIIWLCIIIAGAFIVFFTLSLLKEKK